MICTIGTRPNALVERMTIPVERGRIVVNPDLSVRDTPGLWAIGDCALVVECARRQVRAADRAVRRARGAPARGQSARRARRRADARIRLQGARLDGGDRPLKGVADVFGIPLSGLPAWLLWRAYYLSQMPTLGRKLRIFVEWTWGMFFPTDITHLRFTRSHELDDERLRRGDRGDRVAARAARGAVPERSRIASVSKSQRATDYFPGDVASEVSVRSATR